MAEKHKLLIALAYLAPTVRACSAKAAVAAFPGGAGVSFRGYGHLRSYFRENTPAHPLSGRSIAYALSQHTAVLRMARIFHRWSRR